MVIIVAGLLLEPLPTSWSTLTIALWILAIGTNVTAVQRVWEVWRQNRAELREQRAQQVFISDEPRPSPQPVRAAMRRFFETWGKT